MLPVMPWRMVEATPRVVLAAKALVVEGTPRGRLPPPVRPKKERSMHEDQQTIRNRTHRRPVVPDILRRARPGRHRQPGFKQLRHRPHGGLRTSGGIRVIKAGTKEAKLLRLVPCRRGKVPWAGNGGVVHCAVRCTNFLHAVSCLDRS